MSKYVNSKNAYSLYCNESIKPYFIDKTEFLKELFPLVDVGSYVCVTRPRRFGKTVVANMIDAFFNCGLDSSELFKDLKIGQDSSFEKYINKFNVIHLTLNNIPRKGFSFDEYISHIERKIIKELAKNFSNVDMNESDSLWDILLEIYSETDLKFIFVLDEWDYIFYQDFVTEADKKDYLRFLRTLLKDQPYVSLAYMTGILPIAKYSSGSELNMFSEYTMTNEQRFSEYFGFTDEEVDDLYSRYIKSHVDRSISREDLRTWYDGYYTLKGKRLYNPRSIVLALSNNNIGNYWTSSGPYDEIYYYIGANIDDLKSDLALMVSGFSVEAAIQEYAATSMNLQTKDEVFSAMVVYGFLTYTNGMVSIPNKELMLKFAEMLRKESSFGYVHRLAKESSRMYKATINGDTDTMAQILEYAHDTEVPLLNYNYETELTSIVNLVYLSARDKYRIEREEKSGKGYVDFIFYPIIDLDADCIILELKIDSSPEVAIQQIKEKNYALKFKGKLAENKKYTGRILAVGISYDKEKKKHRCQVEVLD